MTYEQAAALLEKYGQTQVLKYYGELSPEGQKALLQQIGDLDLSLPELVKGADGPKAFPRGHLEPLPNTMTVEEIEKRRTEFEEAGCKAIREGKCAAVLLAGGMGTRLGFDHPKGTYNIGVTRDLYIFECLIENLKRTTEQAGGKILLLIMTSDRNYEETSAFFKEKNYFGYDPDYVRFFRQEMAPCTDFAGNILLEEKGKIANSPNGTGGWFHSLKKCGLLDELHERHIEYISCFGVDNVLVHISDPVYTGAFILSGLDCAGKAVKKADPMERVGVLCLEDGKPSIVEYYEMTDDMINLRDENGDLLYNFGVILNYYFKMDRLEEIIAKQMPYHIVEKKIPYLDENGGLVKPDKPNGCKYELLVLDMIHLMDSCLAYEVVREKEFAPIKNLTGIDSVESARALLEKGV
ncbi:MAG: UDPGP type 1 family protein [Lachnospiraceae bacterium]|nr:UDPGP type 1 family protein [Lachnospiraceae bacterium]